MRSSKLSQGSKYSAIYSGNSVGIYWKNGYWLSCDCNNWCKTRKCPGSVSKPDLDSSCAWEAFKIFRANSNGSGPIKSNEQVYLKRKYCPSSKNSPYISGKNGKWIQTVSNKGSCERWIIKYP